MLRKIYILLFVVVCFACHDDETYFTFPQRTVLIYMAADNNLYKSAKADIAEMQAVAENINGTLLVYFDAPENSENAMPALYRIENGKITTLKYYAPQNSASSETLSLVINDALAMFPADEYGLVLWSHGTGWLPEGVFDSFKDSGKQRSFGLDKGKEMSLLELEQALPIKFEFIAFDACLMSNVETLYQLRNKANFIIASPTETLVAGFPYTEIVPLLFVQNIDYKQIVKTYVDYYRNQTKDYLQSASLCVTQTKFLDTLAQFITQNIENKNIKTSDDIQIQSYEYTEPIMYYDLSVLLQQSVISENKQNELSQIFSQLAIIYEHTEYFLGDLSLENTAGISFFAFPFADSLLENQYRQLDWYIDTKLFVSNI